MLTNKRKAQLIIMTTFLLGLVVGASGQYLWTRESVANQAGPQGDLVEELSQRVHLDPHQRNQVEQIVGDCKHQIQDFKNQVVKPKFTSIRDASRQQIRALLSAEQQELYDQWTREQDLKREQKAKEEAAKNAK
ncbi:MAG TPA: hypothetical protein VJ302_28110 [Blastocatellia bacterium]|nr:hypothetical protein [Blastocatellia bacterium]